MLNQTNHSQPSTPQLLEPTTVITKTDHQTVPVLVPQSPSKSGEKIITPEKQSDMTSPEKEQKSLRSEENQSPISVHFVDDDTNLEVDAETNLPCKERETQAQQLIQLLAEQQK